MKRTILIAALALFLATVPRPLWAAGGTASRPGAARYLVTLSDTVIEPTRSVAGSLAETYGGTVEPADEPGFHGFVIATTPERAKLLQQSSAVAQVALLSGASSARSSRMTTDTDTVDLGIYAYDGSGNIKAIGEDRYLYDSLGRLTSAMVANRTQEYGYDDFGNLKSSSVGDQCSGGDCGRTVSVLGATNHVSSNGAVYDDAGNLTSIDGLGYVYDSLGMMTKQTNGSTILRQFVYTADDERLATYATGGWSWTVRDLGGAVLREFTSQDSGSSVGTANWQWTEDYVYRGSLLLAAVTPQGRRHFHLDHLGTPRLITDDSGNQLGAHTYFPFGSELDLGVHESPEDARKFTGHERDGAPSTHTLDYMHARYYGANMGRFLSVDPAMDLKKTLPNPQMWNRYAYVTNNPARYTDPTGREGVQEKGFTKPLSEANDWDEHPSVSWAFDTQAVLLSFSADEFLVAPALGRAFGAVGRFIGIGSGLARGSVTLEMAIARGAVREGGLLSKIVGGIEAGFKSGVPKSAEAALDVVAKAATAAGEKQGYVIEATDGAKYVLQNVGNVKTFIYKTGEVIVKRGDELLVRYIPK